MDLVWRACNSMESRLELILKDHWFAAKGRTHEAKSALFNLAYTMFLLFGNIHYRANIVNINPSTWLSHLCNVEKIEAFSQLDT